MRKPIAELSTMRVLLPPMKHVVLAASRDGVLGGKLLFSFVVPPLLIQSRSSGCSEDLCSSGWPRPPSSMGSGARAIFGTFGGLVIWPK